MCMKPETIARIRFVSPKDAWRPPATRNFSCVYRIDGEGGEAPYGKWTLLVEGWSSPTLGEVLVASVRPLNDKAPRLRRNMHFTLFEGPYVIGYGEIAQTPRAQADGPRDQDALISRVASPSVGGF